MTNYDFDLIESPSDAAILEALPEGVFQLARAVAEINLIDGLRAEFAVRGSGNFVHVYDGTTIFPIEYDVRLAEPPRWVVTSDPEREGFESAIEALRAAIEAEVRA